MCKGRSSALTWQLGWQRYNMVVSKSFGCLVRACAEPGRRASGWAWWQPCACLSMGSAPLLSCVCSGSGLVLETARAAQLSLRTSLRCPVGLRLAAAWHLG